jgi:histidine ammonia-lyase
MTVGDRRLTVKDVRVARTGESLELSTAAKSHGHAARATGGTSIARGNVYTALTRAWAQNASVAVAPKQAELRHNLVVQLSCGIGEPLTEEVVRAAMLLRIATFATGTSAARVELTEAWRRF